MVHEYKSGIGHIDEESKRIIGEQEFSSLENFDDSEEKQYRLYDCKLVLILNNVYVNGKPQEGKCIYIPIDKDDKRFYSDEDFRHNTYLVNALNNYEWGDEEQYHPIQKKLDSKEEIKYEEMFAILADCGIAVISNLDYSFTEPARKKAMLYMPKTWRESQIKQLEKVQGMLEEENYVIGLNALNTRNTKEGRLGGFEHEGPVYIEIGEKLADRIRQRQNGKDIEGGR